MKIDSWYQDILPTVSAKFCQPMTENDFVNYSSYSQTCWNIQKTPGILLYIQKTPRRFFSYKKIPVCFVRTEKSLYVCKDDQNCVIASPSQKHGLVWPRCFFFSAVYRMASANASDNSQNGKERFGYVVAYNKKAMKTKRQKIPNPDILQYVDWVSNCQEMLWMFWILNTLFTVVQNQTADSHWDSHATQGFLIVTEKFVKIKIELDYWINLQELTNRQISGLGMKKKEHKTQLN